MMNSHATTKRHQLWQPGEDRDLVRLVLEDKTDAEIATYLNRTLSGVECRRAVLYQDIREARALSEKKGIRRDLYGDWLAAMGNLGRSTA
jgi:hypothetical protein